MISSQIATHTVYGGVVPEIASREHIKAVSYTHLDVYKRQPHYRRQGIARKLMDAMVTFARARGVRAIALEVRESLSLIHI